MSETDSGGAIVAIVRKFLSSHLSIMFMVLAACLGIAAVVLTPREEDPQIVVPMADVIVQAPGCSAAEVENLVTTPLERILWQIDGVEHVYSISRRDAALVTVRFYVGEDREHSLTKLTTRIAMHHDIVPPVVTEWVVKPVSIDDVPIVTVTLVSPTRDAGELRRIGEEVKARLDSVADLSRTDIVGGYRREVRVTVDLEKMRGRALSFDDITTALERANVGVTAGVVRRGDKEVSIVASTGLTSVEDVKRLAVKASGQRAVYLRDVARIEDLPEEPETAVRFSAGPACADPSLREMHGRPCVTLAFAKKRGTNAVGVAQEVLERIDRLTGTLIPDDVSVVVRRNSGQTADDKVNELLSSLAFAVLTVVAVLLLTMGWREALVVAMAVPISFALALFVNVLAGYTINRVTLFALILSLGLVVDDPITNVDNIQRHMRMGLEPPRQAVLSAVREVLPPVIMSTLAIIVSFLPMFFITGMMGPYMRPMAINVPVTVTFSTVAALTFVPWLAFLLLRRKHGTATGPAGDVTPGWIRRSYRRMLGPFLQYRVVAGLLLVGVLVLLAVAGLLVVSRRVPLKMLPFDNKNEFQVVVDLPEGTTLEDTSQAVNEIESVLATVNEVTDFQSYVGVASPMDFNGLVRHYYLRRDSNLADIRVNLVGKDRRRMQSHDIALRLRDRLVAAGERHGAVVKIVETPPGPPVLSTVVVEVVGTPEVSYDQLIAGAAVLEERLSRIAGVCEIDDMAETPHDRLDFVLDQEKATLHGVTHRTVSRALHTALEGATPASVHLPNERNTLQVRTRLSRADRNDPERLKSLWVKGTTGDMVQLGAIGRFETVRADQPIYHKNLKPVVFVTAETAGTPPPEAILDAQALVEKEPLPAGVGTEWAGEGEWRITLRVFRDLGLAYAAAMVGIYLLVVLETRSFFMPLVIMTAIPLTAIGIMPGFWLLNVFAAGKVGGYASPIFFTATAMIGMIALGGIVVRNSIVLLEFVRDRVEEGTPLTEAILDSGAVRFRPICLTALTTAIATWPITLDPIFSGLAWSLIFGLCASTVFTLAVVPTILYLLWRRKYA